MPESLQIHEPVLVNLFGHLAGALIFGAFALLLVRDRAASRLPGRGLSVAAALLALTWNLASFLGAGLGVSDSPASRLLVTLAFACVSLLPALLLHIALWRRLRPVIWLGYGLGAAATLIHASELVVPAPHHHRIAVAVIAVGFGALAVVTIVGLLAGSRALSSKLGGFMALFLFALSFSHLGSGGPYPAWPIELVTHHAGIPLVLLILLQDYRLVLLDAIARLLAALALAAGFALAAAAAGLIPMRWDGSVQDTLVLCSACLLFMAFGLARGRLEKLLTRLVFRRADLAPVLGELRIQNSGEEQDYLNWAAARIAAFMAAERPCLAAKDVAATLDALAPVLPAPPSAFPPVADDLVGQGVQVVVPLRLSPNETAYLLLGRRRGGQPYLSEDLDALARLSSALVERVKLMRQVEMERLVARAELRALESQIHPHFLFNALNTLYGVIPRQADGARRTVLNLADIFRYFLRKQTSFLPLAQELDIVKAYLEIESLRLGPKLRTEIDVEPAALGVPIPVLSVQPLVENAVRHGLSPKPEGGSVRLSARLQDGMLRVAVEDSGAGFHSGAKAAGHGLGLDNVVRRLKLCYGPQAGLDIHSDATGSRVSFHVPAAIPAQVRP